MTNAETKHRHDDSPSSHGVLSVNLLFFAHIYSSVVMASDEANVPVSPSSSRWLVQCGLVRVRWLALIL